MVKHARSFLVVPPGAPPHISFGRLIHLQSHVRLHAARPADRALSTMAEEGQQAAISSAFPAPPPFYKSFTASNLDRFREHLESIGQLTSASFSPTDPTTGSIPDSASLPADLQNLIPPSIPTQGTYSTFGTTHTVGPAASEAPPPPTQAHLLDIIRQILLKFLHITHILAIDPSMKFYSPAWDQLDALFKEMHDGINAWRPHQARESLIAMMEDQIKNIRSESERVRESVGRAKEVVEGVGKGGEKKQMNGTVNGHGINGLASSGVKRQRVERRDRMVWETIEREIGSD